MTDVHISLPPALRRALDLLADPPADPDVSKGYLDLLGAAGDETVPKNTGAIQAVWASPIGSMLYDNAQAISRRLISAWQHPVEWLNIPPDGTALDVGSGPGNVTASLARAAGPGGLALGVDISEPMLARAVRAESGPQVGFIRADAQRLPLRDNTVDADHLTRRAAADPGSGGRPGRDGTGATTGRTAGHHGPHRRKHRPALAQLAQRRCPYFRRRRNRRHLGRQRFCQRAGQELRHDSVGARQALNHGRSVVGTLECSISSPSPDTPSRSRNAWAV